jgi:uncharacterized protein (DUF58 family)
LKKLYLTNRFFFSGMIILLLFIAGFRFTWFFYAAQILIVLQIALVIADIFILFRIPLSLLCKRKTPSVLSLSDPNKIILSISNNSKLNLKLEVIDEIPVQFQQRNFSIQTMLFAGEEKNIEYHLRPVTRGVYKFNDCLLYCSTVLGFIQKKIVFEIPAYVSVYPSIRQMKEIEMKAFSKIPVFGGIKKLRRLGHSYEFDQIREYFHGDDYRSINWKATGRRANLMVNQYEDEKSQQVYFVIDKSRRMHMPFNGLSLLDYSVNATLSIANIVIKKHDRAGLITFSTGIETMLKAAGNNKQLRSILFHLYHEKVNIKESDFEHLYITVRNNITARSLLMIFTNFESTYALERVLPVLRKMNKMHLLVVIFFENSELTRFAHDEASDVRDIYHKAVAGDFLAEKDQIVTRLRLYGIQTIYTKPEDLSINVVNKYLELKSRGMI